MRWRPVIGYESLYEVSETGDVKRMPSGKLLKRHNNSQGYPRVTLCKSGIAKQQFVHILVAQSFIGECPIGCEVNHKDLNRCNPSLSNLEYLTPSENMRYTFRIKPYPLKGERHPQHKLSSKDVQTIRLSSLGKRELGRIFGVCHKTICNIQNNLKWRYVDGISSA
jgi:hypothetical protein